MTPKPREFSKQELQFWINRILDDTAQEVISCGAIRGAGARDYMKIRSQLNEWKSQGYLEIINDPEGLEPLQPCVRMLKYIGQKSSIPGFLNWEEPGPKLE